MRGGRKGKFDGLFGEKGARRRKRGGDPASQVREPPLAGVFGLKARPVKEIDRKSPAIKPAPFAPDEDQE